MRKIPNEVVFKYTKSFQIYKNSVFGKTLFSVKGTGKIIMVFLFLFMLVGIILFMASTFSFVKSKIPECYWENDYKIDDELNKEVTSNDTAARVVKSYSGINGTWRSRNVSDVFWEVRVEEDNKILKKYGIDRMGNLYEYEKICEETDKPLANRIIDLLKKAKNISKTPTVEN